MTSVIELMRNGHMADLEPQDQIFARLKDIIFLVL